MIELVANSGDPRHAALKPGALSARVVAEIGGNHQGDFKLALDFVRSAKEFCGAYAVKFQKRSPRECLSAVEYSAAHTHSYHSFGETYGEHREFLEFSLEQHRQLKSLCDEIGIVYSCSVWDLTSAREIVSLKPEFIKVPSACNTHYELLAFLVENFEGAIHLSLGMTTLSEEESILEFFSERGRVSDLVLYACTSGYPVPDREVCLLEVARLKRSYGDLVRSIGFSGHHLGIALDVGAFVLGAEWIERHFTLDRTWRGTDQAASLEPDGLRRVVRDLASVGRALTYKPERMLETETVQRKKLKWDRFLSVPDDPSLTLASGNDR